MLVEFRVQNFRSLREEQVLSLVASKDKTLQDTHTQSTGLKAAPSVLRSAGLNELIAPTPAAYVEQAVAWYRNPEGLRSLRKQWAGTAGSSRLFDTARTARQLESLYRQMQDLKAAGAGLRDLRAG